MAATKFLDNVGLSYFWTKIKAWIASAASNLVHRTGDELVQGIKEFKNDYNDTIISDSTHSHSIVLRSTEITKGMDFSTLDAADYLTYIFQDKSGSLINWEGRLGFIGYTAHLNNSYEVVLTCCRNDNTINSTYLAVGYDSNGIAFALAPPTSTTRTDIRDIVTRGFLENKGYITSSGSITGNAATATKLGTSTVGSIDKPIYLNAGTATTVNSALRTCYGGVESEAVANTYFKIGSGSITGTYNHLRLRLLVQNITGKSSCIWDIWLSSTGTAGVYNDGHSILIDNVSYATDKFIVAYKANSGGTLDFELYVKETARYQNHRFTIIQECWRNSQKVGNILTLYNQLTITGTATITSGYTALTTTNGTVTVNISGNAATASAIAWSGVTSRPTTLSGYGITDAKIASGTITLGSNTITPLTSASTLDATKLSGTASINTTGSAAKLTTARTLWGQSFDGSANVSGALSSVGGITFSDTAANSTVNIAYGKIATNDYFRISAGGAANAGYLEIATADDGNEPISIAQYTGNFATLVRKATLLASDGNTVFPGTIYNYGSHRIRHKTYVKSEEYSSNIYLTYEFHDKNDAGLADILYYLNTPANGGSAALEFRIFGTPNAETSNQATLTVGCGANGNNWASCPTYYNPADNSNVIATTAWIRTATGNTTLNAATATKLATARTINGVSFDGSANITIADSTKLPLAGGSMTGNITFTSDHVRGTAPSAFSEKVIYRKDTNGNQLGAIGFGYNTDKSSYTRIYAYNTTVASGGNIGYMGIECSSSGSVAAVAPTPAASSNNSSIATTAYVNNATCVVHRTGNEDISGSKTFYNPIIRKNETYDVKTIPSSNQYYNTYWYDKNGAFVGRLLYYQNSEANGAARCFYFAMSDMSASEKTMWASGYGGNPSTTTNKYFAFGSWLTVVRPSAANCTLGANSTSQRWGQIYSSSTSISTSDERMKTEISAVPDEVLDCWEQIPWVQFKMKDAVAKKGEQARLHNGMIAQTIKRIFEESELDAGDYGLFCYDEWDEEKNQYDDDGNVIYEGQEAGNLYSLRYEEALCMEAAYQRRKNKILENRISELENQLASVLEVLQSKSLISN